MSELMEAERRRGGFPPQQDVHDEDGLEAQPEDEEGSSHFGGLRRQEGQGVQDQELQAAGEPGGGPVREGREAAMCQPAAGHRQLVLQCVVVHGRTQGEDRGGQEGCTHGDERRGGRAAQSAPKRLLQGGGTAGQVAGEEEEAQPKADPEPGGVQSGQPSQQGRPGHEYPPAQGKGHRKALLFGGVWTEDSEKWEA